MPRFPCPGCRGPLAVRAAPAGGTLVSCPACGLECLADGAPTADEAVLEFACRMDRGELGAAGPESAGLVRPAEEVERMVGGARPAGLTRRVLRTREDYVAHYERISRPGPEPGAAPADAGLAPGIAAHLESRGISRLHRFQEEALREISSGASVVIEAPTASGKTEAFLVPVVDGIAARGPAPAGVRALLVYPTKALARDQLPKVEALARSAGLSAAAFDGDTPRAAREAVLASPPHVLVTNFDVLHHHMWRRTRLAALLSGVRYLVADEAHAYTGVLGSNVRYIVERLGRLAGGFQVVAASATLDDARRFCGRLFGREMSLVRGGGARAEVDLVMLSPSTRTQRELMADLARQLTSAGHRTLVFSGSHAAAELLAIRAREAGVRIGVHRAGLGAARRRAVERAFRDGELSAVSCTPTLELGIDIGAVDGVVSSVVPVNRLMQRIGRAARKGQQGYAFLALGGDPISQYYRNHPRDYMEDAERAYFDPSNPFVEEMQVLAMACDRPLTEAEAGARRGAVLANERAGRLARRGGGWAPAAGPAAAALAAYGIRGTGRSVDILLGGRRVGDRALPMALGELHPEAVYLMGGARYLVRELEYPDGMRARIERLPRGHPYYTRPIAEEHPAIEGVIERRRVFGAEASFCRLRVRRRVTGYARIGLGPGPAQGERAALERPLEYDLLTKGIAFRAPRPASAADSSPDPALAEAGGYHAAEHAIIEGSSMVTGGAPGDLGGISMGGTGDVFVYDGAVGGNGASMALYGRLEEAVRRAARMLGECPCRGEAGCPRCTFSYRCGNNNEFLHKAAGLESLERMAGGEGTELAGPEGAGRPLV